MVITIRKGLYLAKELVVEVANYAKSSFFTQEEHFHPLRINQFGQSEQKVSGYE